MVTQERLKELYTYDPIGGTFRRNFGRQGVEKGSLAGSMNHHFGYVNIFVDDKGYKAHRLAFMYMTGEWPPEEVDHLDGDRSNNAWENLKLCSRSENARNMAKRKDNTSGHVGIGFHKKRNQWRARIMGEHLGWFPTMEEAIKARQEHPSNILFSERHGKGSSEFNNSYKAKHDLR